MDGVKELISKSLDDLGAIAKELVNYAGQRKVWLFIGEMGAGKTTLIKHICTELGVIDQVSSPTFSIVNEYILVSDEIVYHFDFYRLTAVEEAIAIGAEDYFFSDRICLIEWPQLITGLLPDEFMTVHLEELLTGERKIILKHHG